MVDSREEHSASTSGTPSERRQAIISIAAGMFRERGYHAVGMREIGEAADLRAASLYHHFRSKEQLLLEAIAVVNGDFIGPALRQLRAGRGSRPDRLRSLVEAHVLHISRHRDAWWLSVRELHVLSADNLELVQADRREYQREIARFIAAGVRAGDFTCSDPTVVAKAILDMLNGFNAWFVDGGRLDSNQLASLYASLVVDGMLCARP